MSHDAARPAHAARAKKFENVETALCGSCLVERNNFSKMAALPTLLSLDATEVELERSLLNGVCNVKCISATTQEQVR
jgi:hypothetical protein